MQTPTTLAAQPSALINSAHRSLSRPWTAPTAGPPTPVKPVKPVKPVINSHVPLAERPASPSTQHETQKDVEPGERVRPPIIEGRADQPSIVEFSTFTAGSDPLSFPMGSPKVAVSPPQGSTTSGPTPPQAPGSESSRGFEPEGSIDESPVSETPSSPPYVRWRENILVLLNDTDGAQLFLQYLTQQRLEHLMNFWALCNGMKVGEQAEKVPKIANYAYRKFIAPSKSSNLPYKLDCIDDTVRQSIAAKLESKSVDANIFDGAQEQVIEHMAATSYLKFFESEIYLNYIQALDNPDLSDVNSSKYSGGTHSSGSSVSGKLQESSGKGQQRRSRSTLTISSLQSTQQQRFNTMNNRRTEVHPGGADPSRSYGPYHAHSSTWNPVSQNDSEIQSQSSGALGDTTSEGNYSSFTDMSSSQFSAGSMSFGGGGPPHAPPSHPSHPQRRVRPSRHSRHVQDKQMQMHAETNREDPLRHLAQRPNRQGMGPPSQLSPQDFHAQVCQKLNQLIAKSESKKKLAEKLGQVDDASHSVHKTARSNVYKNDESDQSILDDHLSRVFENTPSRSPHNEWRQPNVSMNMTNMEDMSGSRAMMSSGFHSAGHSTWSGRRSGREQQASAASSYSYGHPNAATASSSSSLHPAYHHGGNSSGFAGDLAYYPGDSSASLAHKQVNKSFSDFDFGPKRGPPPGPNNASMSSGMGSRGQPPHHHSHPHQRYPSYQQHHPHHPQQQQQQQQHARPGAPSTNDRVVDWLSSLNNSSSFSNHQSSMMSNQQWPPPDNDQRSHKTPSVGARGTLKTSPRSSGRSSSKLRAKSSDRLNQSQPMTSGGSSGYPPMAYPQQAIPTHKVISSNARMLPHASGMSESGMVIQMIYTFPQNKDDLPYMTRTDSNVITLKDVKDMCPKKGQYRYFFKTAIDDMTVYQEEYDDNSQVPLLSGKVVVECHRVES
ncbi:hypothetical protein TCAL_10723 [Tigriopus californicus]|uniref:RGS domain-containing protein n=1 Tax=Tigriopus californicus TaxID=6832 RepID=A0A553PS47_TIGCA|nr:hypothetical protein TCAL_10723 [Tigriopus californicus]